MKYEKQVSLLIDLIPIIASDANFALKGGTAINLFYMELPRLSVDLDLVYLPIEARDISLPSIDAKLKSLKERLEKVFPYLRIRTNPAPPELSRQLICRREDTQIKIEVNTVIRGTLYPSVNKPLSQEVQRIFKKNAQMQIVSIEDLYGSKICAALDRQHPRDLFDIKLFFERYTLTREIFNAFLFYLISHNRPIAEVIRPTLLGNDMILKLCKILLITAIVAIHLNAQDLGTYGELFSIAETNLVEVIQSKLAKLEQEGSLKNYQAQVQSKVEAKLKRPTSVSGVVHTKKPKTFTFDPSITVTADLKDHKGQIFHKKGEVVNPLHYRSMSKPLVFIDGDELKHIEWALKVLKKYPLAKVILVKGEPLKLMDELGITIYFDQFGKLIQKLGIGQVPALVTQDNNLLKIEEVYPDV